MLIAISMQHIKWRNRVHIYSDPKLVREINVVPTWLWQNDISGVARHSGKNDHHKLAPIQGLWLHLKTACCEILPLASVFSLGWRGLALATWQFSR